MKKSILIIALISFIIGTTSISYGQSTEIKSVKTNEEVKAAPKGGNSEFQKFRMESEMKIKGIDDKIGELKVYFYKNKVKDKVAFQDNLNLLEQKNEDLKFKLAANKDDSTLSSFKSEFNQSLDELRKSLKDFRTKNK